MKREADGDMGAPQKKTRRGDEELRLLIPSKVAGSIIGKGGQNITKLRSQVIGRSNSGPKYFIATLHGAVFHAVLEKLEFKGFVDLDEHQHKEVTFSGKIDIR